jgi:hypothetical protein
LKTGAARIALGAASVKDEGGRMKDEVKTGGRSRRQEAVEESSSRGIAVEDAARQT